MELLFQNLIKQNREEFNKKLVDISNKLSINPNWLLWVMKSESGINPQAQNLKYLVGGKPATGLIQFVDSTARYLGTTVEALYKMNNVQQLDYVYKFFTPYAGKMKSIYDVYSVIFFPLALGKPDTWEFATKNLSAAAVAKSNPIFDLNKDGKITIAEFKQAIDKKIKPEEKSFLFKAATGGAAAILLFALGAYFVLK